MKAAIYGRVRTQDGRQDAENQLGQLTAVRRGPNWDLRIY